MITCIYDYILKKKCIKYMILMHELYVINHAWEPMTNRDREVIENTRSRVKVISKLTNFKIKSWIEGYIGKYGSNP